MEPRDEEPLFPESLIHATGEAANPRGPHRDDAIGLDWSTVDDAAATGRGKLEELKQMIEGKSPAELFAMAKNFVEQRPLQGALVGLGLGFMLGRLLRRS